MISGFLFICLAIIVILCLIPVTIGGLISVFGLGASIVLMVQGYPVLGIFIICLGCSVMGVSLWLLLVSLIIKKKNINKIEEIREDDKETEENIEEYIIEDYTAKEEKGTWNSVFIRRAFMWSWLRSCFCAVFKNGVCR